MDPMLIFMGICLLGIYGCYKWLMYLIREDIHARINIPAKDRHDTQ